MSEIGREEDLLDHGNVHRSRGGRSVDSGVRHDDPPTNFTSSVLSLPFI